MATFLLTRPDNQNDDLAAYIQSCGHKAICAPMMQIEHMALTQDMFSEVEALIITSVQALISIEKSKLNLPDIPVFVVGPVSREKALELGFKEVHATQGGKAGLPKLLANNKNHKFLYVSGDFVSPGTLEMFGETGISYDQKIVYQTTMATHLPQDVHTAFENELVTHTLFTSLRSAQNFKALIGQYGLSDKLHKTKALCMSQPMLLCLKDMGWLDVQVAQTPVIKDFLTEILENNQ